MLSCAILGALQVDLLLQRPRAAFPLAIVSMLMLLSLVFLGFFYQLIPVPALIVLGFWFVLQIIDGFTSLGAAASDASGVAFFAHIGGFVLGLAVGLLIRGVFRFRRRPQFGVG